MGIDFGIKRPDKETPTHSSPPARGREWLSSSEGPANNRGSNLLSGWHKGEVRGQISAVRWRCFLMVMPSQTSLRHSRAVREDHDALDGGIYECDATYNA